MITKIGHFDLKIGQIDQKFRSFIKKINQIDPNLGKTISK